MEGFGDEFADPNATEPEPVEPEIKCVGEVVSSVIYATETVSTAEKAALDKANYGDLPPELWDTRAKEEIRWLCTGPDDLIQDFSSRLFPNPSQTIVIGTNGVYSFGLECADDETVKMDTEITGEGRKPKKKEEEVEELNKQFQGPKTLEERTKKVMEYHVEFAKKNVAFAYKLMLASVEQQAFVSTTRFDIKQLRTKKDAKLLLDQIVSLSSVDVMLRSPIKALGKSLSEKYKELPEKFQPGQKRPAPKTVDRPGGECASVKFMIIDFHDPNGDDAVEVTNQQDATKFKVLVCLTPESDNRKKAPRWLDVECDIYTDAKTVPACAFNDTHFVVLYVPCTRVKNAVIFVDLYLLPKPEARATGKFTLTKVDHFCFRFPSYFANEGILSLGLSAQGIVSICFANGALVFDALRMVEKIHIVFLEGKKYQRQIMSVAVYHPPMFSRPTREVYDALEKEYAEAVAELAASKEASDGLAAEQTKTEEPVGDQQAKPVDESSTTTTEQTAETEKPATTKDGFVEEEVPLPPPALKEVDAEKEKRLREKNLWCGSVVIGSDKGECYGVDWRTGAVHFVEVSPAVEPIFATHYSNGKVFMQTVMSVCGTISNLNRADQITVLPIDRPVAIDSCGALIYIMTKYGTVKVMSSIARQVAREFVPPKVGAKTPLLQYAYKGLKAYPDHMVCIYPSGLVRNLVLTTKEKAKANTKK